MTHSIEYS